jgi:hypothetical protein
MERLVLFEDFRHEKKPSNEQYQVPFLGSPGGQAS